MFGNVGLEQTYVVLFVWYVWFGSVCLMIVVWYVRCCDVGVVFLLFVDLVFLVW